MKKEPKRWLLILFALLISAQAFSDYDKNIFTITDKKVTFMYQADLAAHLKEQKPTTYRYYQRLDKERQRQVYVEHLKSEDQDITDLVMRVYKESQAN